jgi:hypothetical protein
MRKGFRPNSLNMASSLLSLILLIYLTMWYVQASPPPGQDTLFIQSTNQGVVPIQTTTGLSWWVTHSPSFTPQSYTSGSLRSWRVDISGLEDKQVSTQTTRTIDHIFTLRAIIEEARHRSSKVYSCFVDFRKAFDTVPREALFQRLRDIGISETLLAAIMRLYESVLGRLRMAHGLSDFIQSTIGVKQGCPLSSTLFGIYIDELESFLHEHIQEGDGCLLHQVLISLLLFVDDLVLLASTPEGLQRQIDALANFCDLRQLTVNLGKTKVLIFNASKSSLTDLHFYYRGAEIEITTTYTYLGVQFTGPRFGMRQALQPRLSKGYGSLALIERQCFLGQFQDISSKLYLMEAIIRPTVLYGSEIWGSSLLQTDWARMERVQTLLLRRIIRCKRQFHSPLFRQSSVSTHSASRSFSAWSLSFIESGLSETLPSGESGTPTSHFAPQRLLLRIPPQAVHEVGSQRHLSFSSR